MIKEVYIGNISIKDSFYIALLSNFNSFTVNKVPKNNKELISYILDISRVNPLVVKFVKKIGDAWLSTDTNVYLYPLHDSEKRKIISELRKNNISFVE